MLPPRRLFALPSLLLAAWLVTTGTAWAIDPEVRDNARLFSPGTVREADQMIKELHRTTGKELLIETYDGVPPDRLGEFHANRGRFYDTWAKERTSLLGLNGIYVMIVREKATD